MRLADLKVTEMIQLGKNLADLLAGPKLSAIDPAVRATLAASIGTKPAKAAEYHAEANKLLAQAYAMFAKRDAELSSLARNVRQVKDTLKAVMAPAEQFLLAGFNAPGKARRIYEAKKPSRLSVLGYSNIGNKGTFKGNNRNGAVTYEIWRREGKEGAWTLRMLASTGKFTDSEVVFGTRYEYKVRAVAAKSRSAFSNTTAVLGT